MAEKTITVGYIGDNSGPLAALNGDGVKAAQARVDLQNAKGGINGRKIVLKVQDTQSSPTNVLTGVKTLVTRDRVFSVIQGSCVFSSAAPYLAQQKVPVVTGFPCDGYEWAERSTTNMIAANGAEKVDAPAAYHAKVLKEAGVTKLATVAAAGQGPGIATEKAIAKAAKALGIKVVYVNESQTVPATALSSVAVSIQRSGADGVSATLADYPKLFAALKAQGVKTVNFSPAGYNPAFLSDANNRAALEGQVTTFPWAPVLLNTPATKTFAAAIKKYAPSIGTPGLAAYTGWVGADATITGLLAAGKDLTRANMLDKLHATKDYTAGGLNAGPVDLAVDKQGTYELVSTGNCGYALKVEKGQYRMLSDKPVCVSSSGD
ncbi:ABC transporter substrate-binding protein [Streptomyces sp. NPDC029041]|uniref:ABC transporter substrate-binding protein n=1 Tax=Streptomyces sp. NPDC029041 TaxID=3155727 RepID=UPI0033C0AC0E